MHSPSFGPLSRSLLDQFLPYLYPSPLEFGSFSMKTSPSTLLSFPLVTFTMKNISPERRGS